MTDMRERVARAIYKNNTGCSWEYISELNAPNVTVYLNAADVALSACSFHEMRKALDGLLKVFVEDLGECGYDETDIADHEHVKVARSILERTGDKT